ncbi:MAG: recombination regulator RecX [Lachnospiraceae bacterium]|nr:recombination regulator RecX [Lachnospiraceae bacterium]
MYRVTEVSPYNKMKVRVKLDSGFTFALYKGEISKYKIFTDEYISEEILNQIVDEVLKKRAKERALYLISDVIKTKKQITDKLEKDCYPKSVIDYVISFLEEYSFVDDYSYACSYVQTYSSRKSVSQLKCDLYKKGIEKSMIESVLSECEIDEDASIDRLMERGIRKYDINDISGKRKLYAMLMRKGYGYDCINRALNRAKNNYCID